MQLTTVQNVAWWLVFGSGIAWGIPERVTSAITGANNGSIESLLFSIVVIVVVGILKPRAC